ncbi:BTAD domain-containing putative transcriptional regulator [Saccharopolyspora elongata]|uniref:AfsR/SARP family transcriptional regulator n=1 Tax=Saccharopolyspora elongata TaxID=2530387 RepID=A0A4R4YYP5_9PSEU|nr:BTAD domain-containing putative transcriptional regulator [Saccharopolyspora elongata]TDD50120.1 AfsR/SARP family transcriptional regulator [Saccharopolyspora elongata]
MRVTVLGPVGACAEDGTPIRVPGSGPRMLLARLALSAGEIVPTGSLIDDLWYDDPPADAVNALHAVVYRLRKALGDAGTLESTRTGYRLAVPAENVDAHRFEEMAARGRRELAADVPREAAASLGAALALWQGTAFSDVLDAPFATRAGVRLEELRIGAVEDRFDAELRLGHHAEILADLETLSAEHPLRERLAALRMRALHAAGRQADALAVHEELRGTLADELGVDPSAEVREAHLAVLRGGTNRPAARPESAPGRLPAPLTTFVGRDDELALLAELMQTSRLVTVLGPGGVGKTRLAVEAASRHRAHRRGRLWLVPLAGVSGPGSVADAVLGVLSSPDGRISGGGPGDPLDRVVELLGGGEAVLVLDNCEHVVGAAAEFARQLLERQPQLAILATSRESLEVMGEALCRLGPLDLPRHRADPADASGSAAVRLFVDRAAAVRPGFELNMSTVDAVVNVVRRLDGLPLALELAAARLRAMSPEQIERRLDDRFRLLSTGNRGAQPRQRTLHAVIEWSWDLLTEQERLLARRMSVFPAATGGDAAVAVCSDAADLPADDVGYVLDALVEKSIVEQTGNGYRMLESIRAHAAHKLRQAGEEEPVRGRFTRYFAELAEEHEPLLRSARQPESLLIFDAEYDNLMFALRSAIDDEDPGTAVQILGPLYWYWNSLRYDARSDNYVARVVEFGDALPEDARAAFTAIHLLAGDSGPKADAERTHALIEDCARTGALQRYPMLLMATLPMGHFLGLDELVARQMREVRARSDRWATACTFMVEAFIHRDQGDWGGCSTALAHALRGFEETGDRLWTAMVLSGQAQVRSVDGDHDEAIAAFERSLALTPQDAFSYRIGLATERMRSGDLDGARRDIDAAEQEARDRGQRFLEAETLVAIAEFHRRSGHPDRADRVLDRMALLARETPLPAESIEARIASARMANRLAAGDAAGARVLLPSAVTAAFAHRDIAPAAQQLAMLLRLEGDPVGAATALGMSQTIRGAFDHGDPELRELVTELARRLGQAEYDEAYRRGAEMPRHEALDRLTAYTT